MQGGMMEREARMALEARIQANQRLARHRNVSIAEGRIHTGRGESLYIRGQKQTKRKGGE